MLFGSLVDRIIFVDPAGLEIIRKAENAHVCVAHSMEQREGGADVGALFHRAAAAVEDDFAVVRLAFDRVLQRFPIPSGFEAGPAYGVPAMCAAR